MSFAVLGLLVIGGCKKDTTTTKNTLDGSLSLVMPEYLEVGFSKTFSLDTMMTVSRPDNKPIGYYFTNPFTEKNDTVVSVDGLHDEKLYTFTVKDTIGVVSFSFAAMSSDDYYGKSATAEFTVVKRGLDGEGSITGFSAYDGDELLLDERDGRNYPVTEAGGRKWMRTNLAWEGAGTAYRGYDVLSDIFGRYYTWEEARNACPEGWTLPSEEDWKALAESCGAGTDAGGNFKGMAGKLLADLRFNKTRMWEFSRYVKITDEARLSVMPSGYASLSPAGTDFSSMYRYAAIWTSDEDGERGVMRYIYRDSDNVFRGLADKTTFAASVRCVKE